MKEFKDILREKRNALGLSQQELADELCLYAARICDWEKGKCFPNFCSLLALADVLKCSVDELMGRKTK